MEAGFSKQEEESEQQQQQQQRATAEEEEEEKVLNALLNTFQQSAASNELAVAAPNVPSISCMELLKYSNFQSKMMAKLQQMGGQDGTPGSSSDGSDLRAGNEQQQNVFKALMSKIKSLETSQAILELYTSQISDCYRSVLSDHDRIITAHSKHQQSAHILDVSRREEQAKREATRSRISGADRVLQILADRGFADADILFFVLCAVAAAASSFVLSIGAIFYAANKPRALLTHHHLDED